MTQATDQIPDIPLPSADSSSELRLVSQNDFDAHKKDFDFQKSIINWTFGFIVAILIVCFFSYVTFLMDAWKFHDETTKDYRETLKELHEKNVDLKIQLLENKIEQSQKEKTEQKVQSTKPGS